MRFKAVITDKIKLQNGRARILLETDGYIADRIEDDTVSVDLKKYKRNRSLEQNRLMWALLEKMAYAQGMESWECYIDMLEHHGARYEYLMALPEAVPMIKAQFRATREVERREYNDKEMSVLKCYYGSSTWDTAEMTEFIEKIIRKLGEMGIDYRDEYEMYREFVGGKNE